MAFLKACSFLESIVSVVVGIGYLVKHARTYSVIQCIWLTCRAFGVSRRDGARPARKAKVTCSLRRTARYVNLPRALICTTPFPVAVPKGVFYCELAVRLQVAKCTVAGPVW